MWYDTSGQLDIDVIELTEALFRWGQANLDGPKSHSFEFHSVHDGLAHIATESDTESCSNNDELMEDKETERTERLSVVESMLPRDLERIQVCKLRMFASKNQSHPLWTDSHPRLVASQDDVQPRYQTVPVEW